MGDSLDYIKVQTTPNIAQASPHMALYHKASLKEPQRTAEGEPGAKATNPQDLPKLPR